MDPSVLIGRFLLLFVIAPVLASLLAFKGRPQIRAAARIVLLLSFIANGAATAVCVRYALAKPSTGIGNHVLLLVAIPFAFLTIVWFAFWRGARRHAYVQSLPPGERRYAELEDIEHALEAAKESLARTERKLKGWLLGADERERLRFELGILQTSISNLEQQRAKRL